MPLNEAYFQNLCLETVWRKNYEKNSVDSCLNEIRAGVAELNRENEELRSKAKFLADRVRFMETDAAETQIKKQEISETLLSAKSLSQTILSDATESADKLVAEAEEKAAAIIAAAQAQAAELVAAAEAKRDVALREQNNLREQTITQYRTAYEQTRKQHEEYIESLDRGWQAFLCGLYEEEPLQASAEEAPAPVDSEAEVPAVAEENPEEEATLLLDPEGEEPAEESAIPDDISERVEAILKEMRSLSDEDDGE